MILVAASVAVACVLAVGRARAVTIGVERAALADRLAAEVIVRNIEREMKRKRAKR